MNYLSKRVQRQLLKLATVDAGTASMFIVTAFVPALEKMVVAGTSAGETNRLINYWLFAWQKVRHLCDSHLNLDAERYTARPHLQLSPILARFEDKLRSIQDSPNMDGQAMLAAVRDASSATVGELVEFNDWAKTAGREVDFDAAKYEGEAARRALHRWAGIVRQIAP